VWDGGTEPSTHGFSVRLKQNPGSSAKTTLLKTIDTSLRSAVANVANEKQSAAFLWHSLKQEMTGEKSQLRPKNWIVFDGFVWIQEVCFGPTPLPP
jgi:hypothetical protein